VTKAAVLTLAEPTPTSEPSEVQCRAQCDANAIRLLQRVHAPVLLRYLMRVTKGDVHRAEDILQETLLRAWSNPDARNGDGQWSRAWLFTVARRIAIDHIRATQARPAEYSDERIEAHALVDDDIERFLDAQEVRAAVIELPERLRTIVIEIYFRERSVAETAAALDVPAGTVKSRTFYALRALREALVDRGFVLRPLSTA
jgi:RNA polymerase sigma-70 factor (ECF subfamily)